MAPAEDGIAPADFRGPSVNTTVSLGRGRPLERKLAQDSEPAPRELNTETGTHSRIHIARCALRGIAALVVVLFHWQHFFFVGNAPPSEAQAGAYAHVLRHFGCSTRWAGWAWILFFSLSGFILLLALFRAHPSATYQRDQIFSSLRFSRLYPLHFMTLLAVAVGQYLYGQYHETSFVYEQNDLRHFLLNLGLVPSVGLEQGLSFNGPVWSVSVEIVPLRRVLCIVSISETGVSALLWPLPSLPFCQASSSIRTPTIRCSEA